MQTNENLAAFLVLILEAMYAFGVLIIACELGQRINLAFEECNDMIDQFEWYLFPVEIQRLLPLLWLVAQQPIEIVCFGSKACDRDTFKQVPKLVMRFVRMLSINALIFILLIFQIVKTAYSYFTMLCKLFK